MYMYFITTETVNCYVRTVTAIMLVPDVLIIQQRRLGMIIHTKTQSSKHFCLFSASLCLIKLSPLSSQLSHLLGLHPSRLHNLIVESLPLLAYHHDGQLFLFSPLLAFPSGSWLLPLLHLLCSRRWIALVYCANWRYDRRARSYAWWSGWWCSCSYFSIFICSSVFSTWQNVSHKFRRY